MRYRNRAADGELVGRALCDIAQVLESGQGSSGRLRAALELLGTLVPYQQCALLDAEPGSDPRLLAVPDMPPNEKDALTHALVQLFGKMLEERSATATSPSHAAWLPHAHLAVPLIGLDEVIGVLFVRRADGTYEKGNLRVLSLVAAQLSAYLTMLRARAEETGRAQELEHARQAAESASLARNELVNLVAQEMRTPLVGVMAWVHLLGSQDLTAGERTRALKAIERSVRTHARLIGELIESSGSAAEELQLALRQVDLTASIEAALHGLRPLAHHRSISLLATLDPSVRPVLADSDRLDEILDILLANAFEFTPDGGRVELRLEPSPEGARIRVIDTGTAIGPGELRGLFDRFTPSGKPTTRRYTGLAIARQLIELHGGTIRAENVADENGAVFTVELPTA